MDRNRGQVFYGTAGIAAFPLAACLLIGGCTSLPKGELTLDLSLKDRGGRVVVWEAVSWEGGRRRRGV